MTRNPRKKKLYIGTTIGKTIAYTILVLTALLWVFPFFYALGVSFNSPDAVGDQIKWFPTTVDIASYVKFFVETADNGIPVWRAFLNTILYVTPPILFGVLCSALAAYAVARINFKGKNVVFFMVLATIVIPGIITLVPSFLMYTQIYGWNEGWTKALPLIIPGMFGSALTMFFLTQYFRTLPKELEEAAEIDGMGKFGIFFKIILPLSWPAIITQIILSFNGCYNDYMGPLLYVGASQNMWTMQLLVSSTSSVNSSPYPYMMAASIITLLPTLLLFIFCQKYFVEGIAMTGMK